MVLLIITGCTKRKYNEQFYDFFGGNEFWSAQYMVNVRTESVKKHYNIEYDSNSVNIFMINYKKDDSQLSSAKHLEVSYKSSFASGKITVNLEDVPGLSDGFSASTVDRGGAIVNKGDVIEVTVNLDGKVQTFELKN